MNTKNDSNQNLAKALHRKLVDFESPHVLKNFRLPWPIFEFNFENWSQLFDEHTKSEIEFDVGQKNHHDATYWERERGKASMTMSEFLRRARVDSNEKWYSFSYKDIDTWPDALKDGIDFAALGFEEAQDILFWIGSQAAHTPCHYDSYGFNIVVQVFGR